MSTTRQKNVTCSKCGKDFDVRDEVERDQLDSWICPSCGRRFISLELLDFIKERIALNRTEDENHGRFVLRELIQNADDARATIVVIRFEPDALYVANNGRSFTTHQDGDFDRISLILKRHQAEDKEATGHFGSGFQTVYALTNSPEVHSSGRSGRMNPVKKEWDDIDAEDRLISPYIRAGGSGSKGVIFRFPWRDRQRAEDDYGGERPFSNPDDWPQWDRKSERKMYSDLKNYVHELLLCCKNLQCIRLTYVDGKSEAYQVERDYELDKVSTKPRVVTVHEGQGELKDEWYKWDSRNVKDSAQSWECFPQDSWNWGSDSQIFRYLMCSGFVSDDREATLHVGKTPDKTVIMAHDPGMLKVELKRNDFTLFFPLFTTDSLEHRKKRSFLYSTIPLPRRGENWFVFTGHFFPEEGRKDVAVTSFGGVSGEWHKHIVKSVARLYLTTFERFVQEVKGLPGIGEQLMQRIIMDSVPAVHVSEWMRPGREFMRWGQDLHSQIVKRICQLPVLWTGRKWAAPSTAYWVRRGEGVDKDGAAALDMFGIPAFTEEFLEHEHCSKTLMSFIRERELKSDSFVRLFDEFSKSNLDGEGYLIYNQALKSGLLLDKDGVTSLLRFCVRREDAWQATKKLSVVPGADDILRKLDSYPLVPSEFGLLKPLVVKSMLIHPDFEQDLRDSDADARTMKPDDVIATISKIASTNPGRYETLSPGDHETISGLVKALCRNVNFVLKPDHMNSRFIPCRYRGVTILCVPNYVLEENGNRALFDGKRPERYRREFIYAAYTGRIVGLTSDLANRIRFLDLKSVSEEDVDIVSEKLRLRGLQEDSIPTNLVRHFFSDRHESLFRDEISLDFFENNDTTFLSEQKKEFQKGMLAYYQPPFDTIKDTDSKGKTEEYLQPWKMAKVPLFYDSSGEWHEAGSFAIEMSRELEMLGYKNLHSDFGKWPRETFLALGVVQRPESSKIIEEVGKLASRKDEHRCHLADIVCLIVLSSVPWQDKLKELSELEWVPTRDGFFRKPSETLLPSQNNIGVVGIDCDCLLDLSACSSDFSSRLQEALDSALDEQSPVFVRSAELGLQTSPTAKILLDIVEKLVHLNSSPPKGLMLRLNQTDLSAEMENREQGHFYHGGRWWKGSEILLTEDDQLSKAMSDGFLVLGLMDAANEVNYLKSIRVRSKPHANDILIRIAELADTRLTDGYSEPPLSLTLWNYLESLADQIEPEACQKYGKMAIYPIDKSFVSPSRVIVSDDSDLCEAPGWYGEWYVLPGNRCLHKKSLHALGAQTSSESKNDAILIMLDSISSQNPDTISADLAEKVLRLLAKLEPSESNVALASSKVWPVVHQGEIGLGALNDFFVRDSPEAAYFESDLPFLYDTLEGRPVQHVRQLVLDQRGSDALFSSHLATEMIQDGVEDDEPGTFRLRLMATALRFVFLKDRAKGLDAFQWLEDARMVKARTLGKILRVGKVSHTARSPCISNLGEYVSIYRINADSSLYDEMTNVIVGICELKGFGQRSAVANKEIISGQTYPGYSKADLEGRVYRLLTRDPYEWHQFIQGLAPLKESLPPLMASDEEFKPGYGQIKQKLLELYGCCQICGRRTPASDTEGDTCERVRSVVSLRGGVYKGDVGSYELSNSLMLCPSHHALFERGLVRLKDLEGYQSDIEGVSRSLARMSNEWKSQRGIRVLVFEAQRMEDRPMWRESTLYLDSGHAEVLLKWLSEWVRSQNDD